MNEDLLVHPLIVSVVFFAAAYLKFRKEMVEEFFSYLCVASWFALIWIHPEMNPVTVHVIERWSLLQIPVVVLVFHVCLWWYRRKYKKSIMDVNCE